jgi:hypothetical protein
VDPNLELLVFGVVIKSDDQRRQDVSAKMAELVEAPGLSPGTRNGVGVRVPIFAPAKMQALLIFLALSQD